MLANRAKADEKLGRNSEALADVDEALQIVEHAREHLVPTDSMKQGYGERLQRLFAFAVELRARLGHPEARSRRRNRRARGRFSISWRRADPVLPARRFDHRIGDPRRPQRSRRSERSIGDARLGRPAHSDRAADSTR